MAHNLFNPAAYKAIRLWGERIGFHDGFIQSEQDMASRLNAPVDAIYLNGVGTWRTIRDLHPEHPVRIAYDNYHTRAMQLGEKLIRVASVLEKDCS